MLFLCVAQHEEPTVCTTTIHGWQEQAHCRSPCFVKGKEFVETKCVNKTSCCTKGVVVLFCAREWVVGLLLIVVGCLNSWLRPYQEESTTSRLISEVKSLWAQSVPGLETTWEHWVLQSLFAPFCFAFQLVVVVAASRLLYLHHSSNAAPTAHTACKV